jgi:hypothetical protein
MKRRRKMRKGRAKDTNLKITERKERGEEGGKEK